MTLPLIGQGNFQISGWKDLTFSKNKRELFGEIANGQEVGESHVILYTHILFSIARTSRECLCLLYSLSRTDRA